MLRALGTPAGPGSLHGRRGAPLLDPSPDAPPPDGGLRLVVPMRRVRARFESDGSRLKLADGKVFKIG